MKVLNSRHRVTRKKGLQYLWRVCVCAFVTTCILRYGYGDHVVNMKNRIVKEYLKIPDKISCYHEDNLDKEPPENTFPMNSIFLISARCDNLLTMHDSCVIESVVRSHNHRKVFVLLARPFSRTEGDDNLLRGLKVSQTLYIHSINIDNFVVDTPLERIFTDDFLNIGIERYNRVREVLKFAALYRFGGIVIDLEMLVAKSMNYLGENWIGKVNSSWFGSAVLALNKRTETGKILLEKSAEILKGMQNATEIDIGSVLTKAYQDVCTKGDKKCTDFQMYAQKYFYPFKSSESHKYFQPGDLLATAYGYYIWDKNDIIRKRNSLYVKIMKELCPSVLDYWTVKTF